MTKNVKIIRFTDVTIDSTLNLANSWMKENAQFDIKHTQVVIDINGVYHVFVTYLV